jgi:hypothetical protein
VKIRGKHDTVKTKPRSKLKLPRSKPISGGGLQGPIYEPLVAAARLARDSGVSPGEMLSYYHTALYDAYAKELIGAHAMTGGAPHPNPPKVSKIHCNIEWHSAHFTSQLAASVYHIAYRVSGDSGTFRASIPTLAEHLGVDPKTMRAAYQFLVELGFFVVIREIEGESTEYRVVGHKEWAEEHPGQCCVKLEIPDTDDPLARALHGISGKNFWKQYLDTIRRYGFSDEQIISYAKVVWAAHTANPKGSSFHNKLTKHLRERDQRPAR